MPRMVEGAANCSPNCGFLMNPIESDQEIITHRLREMGIEAHPMEGGRCALARMRLQNPSFPTPSGSLQIDHITFSTVGRDRIKCLKPRALFQLPLLRIISCRDATGIEAHIHLAWQKHQQELSRARSWLESIGTHVTPDADGSILTFSITGETPEARAIAIDSTRVILPGPGPLSGLTLQRAEDRTLSLDRSWTSSVELDIGISNRLEELRRLDSRLVEERRRDALTGSPTAATEFVRDRKNRLLLVGPRLARERSCIESLRVRGYRVETAQSQSDALQTFENSSPELVMADMQLGRSEGIELILALRRVPGLEEIPVVLVDDRRRPERREVAQRLGATGYLVHPVEVNRISKRLDTLMNEPRRRRFTRYAQRLSVHMASSDAPCLATKLGRGGMFLNTERELPTHSLQDCELSVPQLGHTLRVQSEVLYQTHESGDVRPGVGVRFHDFHNSHEPLLINYLNDLERQLQVPA
jgi:CheY-like chemotaxis protein